MPDGGSQSPITMRLNLLANRRTADRALRQRILARLRDASVSAAAIATTAMPDMPGVQGAPGTQIAVKNREVQHVNRWPSDQLELLRVVVQTAIEQDRPTFYDWQLVDDDPHIVVRDNGEGVFITFK